MFDRAILALALVSAIGFAGPVFACEMHKDGHAKLTTATAEPAPQQPAPVMEVDTKAMQVAPIVPAEPAMTKRQQSSGYMGCMRNKQTVLLRLTSFYAYVSIRPGSGNPGRADRVMSVGVAGPGLLLKGNKMAHPKDQDMNRKNQQNPPKRDELGKQQQQQKPDFERDREPQQGDFTPGKDRQPS